jgi:hypothetical protein
MRSLAAAALLALAVPAADELPTIALEVGEERTGLGIMPRCDDLGVVAITADGRGVRGLRPGRTICSFDRSGGGGARHVYRIVVTAPKPKEGPGGEAR